MPRPLTTAARPLLLFIWAVLAAVILLRINITGEMSFWASLLYVAVLVPTHMAGAHILADLVLPYFIRKKRMLQFALLLLLVCTAIAVFLAFVDVWLGELLDFQVRTASGTPMPFIPRIMGLFVGLLLTSSGVCGIRFYAEHNQIEKLHQQLRAEHLEAELKLLRDQINPHFMFNVLNSIHVLMHRDTQKASRVLFQFADMLRYQLYDCSQPSIPLEQEIAYLQNFVNIEKVRWGDELRLHCEWPTLSYSYTIAPFILAPFVENAFKHASRSAEGESYINIQLGLEAGEVRLEVSNSCDAATEAEETPKAGGIGLENVKKRLALLYPDRYTLQLQKED
ncbi:MAG: histidine kinase, partial [Hymenobacteraceae bacterium]|nr:histidine kinase [Hymenobacteraceae bacterium]